MPAFYIYCYSKGDRMNLYRTFFLPLMLLVVAALSIGCAVNQAPAPSSISGDYRPAGREQFKLVEIPSELAKYGYNHFCTTIRLHECFNEKTISANDGSGLKGYFLSSTPIKEGDGGVAVYPVMLSNGRKMYFISDHSKGGHYGKGTYIEPLFVEKFSQYPIYEGASTMVIGRAYGSAKEKFKLSTGEEVSAETLNAISMVADRFSNPEVADLLVGSDDIRIETDRVEGITYVKPFYYSNKSSYQIHLAYTDNHHFFRVKLKYYGSDWIFANSITVSANDFRWRSGPLPFKRDHYAEVWEWVDVPLDAHYVSISERLSNSDFAVIRFHGKSYYSDLELTDREQENLILMLKLKNLIEAQ